LVQSVKRRRVIDSLEDQIILFPLEVELER
jgi:hypothetical protein